MLLVSIFRRRIFTMLLLDKPWWSGEMVWYNCTENCESTRVRNYPAAISRLEELYDVYTVIINVIIIIFISFQVDDFISVSLLKMQ